MGRKDDKHDVIVGQHGTYKLMERLGKGGRGVVYKALLITEGNHVAVKRVLREQMTPEEEDALHYEIDLLKNLHDEYVVNYYEAIDDTRSNYLDIVMEYVEGGSLEQLIKTVAKVKGDSADPNGSSILLEERIIARFVKQILEGLTYLHFQGVIHRDIKGANILITKDSRVKLSDFGVSVRKHRDSTNGDLDAVGTPYWMAPEIISLTGVSTVSDIWSLGCTIIELLTGFPPYGELNEFSAMYRIVTDDRPPLPPDISASLEDFLLKCFDKDINSRATAEELLKHRWILENAGDPSLSTSTNQQVEDIFDDEDGADLFDQDQNIAGRSQKMALNRYEEKEEDSDEWLEIDESGDAEGEQSPVDFAGDADWISDSDFEDDPVADLERERERRHVEQWERTKKVAGRLLDDSIVLRMSSASSLAQIFTMQPEQKSNFLVQPGLLPILENLEDPKNEELVESILRLLNILMDDGSGPNAMNRIKSMSESTNMKGSVHHVPEVGNVAELLCLSGFVPVIIPFCDRSHMESVRLLAGRSLQRMIQQRATVHMLCACRVSSGFISLLEPDLSNSNNLEMTKIGISGLKAILMNADRAFFTRKMCNEKALERIAACIDWMSQLADSGKFEQIRYEAAGVIQIFAKRPDPLVKRSLADKEVVSSLVKTLDAPMREDLEPTLELFLSSILDLSRDPQTHKPLEDAGVIPRLVSVLDNYHQSYADHTCSALVPKMMTIVISTLSYLCRVSSKRQELACVAGIIPHLQWFINNSPLLKAWSLEIFAGLAMVSEKTRIELWKNDSLSNYVSLLQNPSTLSMYIVKILQSLNEWLESDKERVEAYLVALPEQKDFGNGAILRRCIEDAKRSARGGGDAGLEQIMKLLRQSELIASAYIVPSNIKSILESLSAKQPRLLIILMRLISLILDMRLLTREYAEEFNILEVLDHLVKEKNAVTVTEQASLLLRRIKTDLNM